MSRFIFTFTKTAKLLFSCLFFQLSFAMIPDVEECMQFNLTKEECQSACGPIYDAMYFTTNDVTVKTGAEQVCESRGGHLPSIFSTDQIFKIASCFEEIGNVQQTWVEAKNPNLLSRNQADYRKRCAKLTSVGLTYETCDSNKRFLCEKQRVSAVRPKHIRGGAAGFFRPDYFSFAELYNVTREILYPGQAESAVQLSGKLRRVHKGLEDMASARPGRNFSEGTIPAMAIRVVRSRNASANFTRMAVESFEAITKRKRGFVAVLAEINLPLSNLSLFLPKSEPEKVAFRLPTGATLLSASAYSETRGMRAARSSKLVYSADVRGDSCADEYARQMGDDETVTQIEYRCAFIDHDVAEMATRGCAEASVVDGRVRCKCNHTTMFAVILAFHRHSIPHGIKIASFVAVGLSVFCLLITVIYLLVMRKSYSGDRLLVQVNLALALLLFYAFKLMHDLALRSATACEIEAITTHYFLLASGFWMLNEGLTLSSKTSKSFFNCMKAMNRRSWDVSRLLLGWGTPAVIVVIAATIGHLNGTYMEINPFFRNMIETSVDHRNNSGVARDPYHFRKYLHCLVNSQSTALYVSSLMAPLLVLSLINSLIVGHVAYFVYGKSVDANKFKPEEERNHQAIHHVELSLKAVLTLLPVLGIGWIFGFLSGLPSSRASIAFSSIHVAVNGLQGVFIFYLYCCHGAASKHVWRKIIKKASMFTFSTSK